MAIFLARVCVRSSSAVNIAIYVRVAVLLLLGPLSQSPSPHISQCSVGVLTVPEKSTLSLSCLVQPNQNLATNWSRDHGHMDKSRTSTSIHLQDGMENVSLHITDVKNSDEDVYTLKASNVCGEDVYQVQVIVQKGGCSNYQPPNATRIISSSTKIAKGSTFSLLCYFNGDTHPGHYNTVWSKDSIKDLVGHGPPGKYHTDHGVSCSAGKPCCFSFAQLMVSNAIGNDSGTYSCSALPTSHKYPAGSSLSLHIKVQSSQAKNDVELTDLAVGIVSGGAILFLYVVVILCYVSCSRIRSRRRTRKFNLLINDDSSSTLYGSLALNHGASACPPIYTGLGTRDVFILYGLELDKFRSVRKVNSPAHSLIMDLVSFLEALKIPCGHDAHVSSSLKVRSFSAEIEQRVERAKVVIVVCSEVLCTAFSKASSSSTVQMKFGRFRVQRIRGCIAGCPSKFVPVVLAGHPPVFRELGGQKQFNVEGFVSLLRLENVEEALKRPELSELYAFVQHLRQLLS